MNKDKRDLLITVIIGAFLTLLIVGGSWGIWKSSDLNEYIEGKRYNLEFYLITSDFNSSSGEVIHINGFVFYYDFTKNRGNISFDLHKNWSIDYIRIEFPSVVDNDSLKIYTKKNGEKLNINLTKDYRKGYEYFMGHNYTCLILSDFERTFYDETFVIEFESDDLKPKGRFGFYNPDKNFLHSSVVNVNFVLGDDYECRGACVCDLHYIEETPNSFDTNLQLAFKKEKATDCSTFKLNAIRNISFLKSLLLGLGIALMVTAIGVGFELWKYRRDKDN